MGRRPLPKRITALTLRYYAVLATLSGSYSPLRGRYQRVTHPFATSPVRRRDSFDLHVLGTPPAFILSQDQTLQICSHRGGRLGLFELGAQKNFWLCLPRFKRGITWSIDKSIDLHCTARSMISSYSIFQGQNK